MAVVDPCPLDITPSVAEVAALLRARTKDINGDEIGTFNDDTRPTSGQVITLIGRPSSTSRHVADAVREQRADGCDATARAPAWAGRPRRC